MDTPQIPTPSDMLAACRSRAPWDMGCRCDRCGLGEYHRKNGTWQPVFPELNPTGKAVVLAEGPAATELLTGTPLSGRSGKMAESGLHANRIYRQDMTWDNGALCAFPGGKAEPFLLQLSKDNKRREAAGVEPLLNPFEACAPHVAGHILTVPNVLAMGKFAYASITGQSKRIRAIRGAFMDLVVAKQAGTGPARAADPIDPANPPRPSVREDGRLLLLRAEDAEGNKVQLWPEKPDDPILAYQNLRVTPTLHPAFVLRYLAWEPVFRHDIERFWLWIHGQLRWDPPKFHFRPSYEDVDRFLSSSRAIAVDCETDGKDSLTCNLRCISFSTPEGGIVVPFLSPRTADGRKVQGTLSNCRVFSPGWSQVRGCHDYADAYYTDAEALAIYHRVRRFLLDRNVTKVLHNCLWTGTSVVLADGTTRDIEDIVRRKDPVYVLGMDEQTGEVRPARVLNWIRNRVGGQRWIQVTFARQKRSSLGIRLTPDHELITTGGRVRADALQAGTRIYWPERRLSPEQRSALLGTLMGDSGLITSGSISDPEDAPTATLVGGHVTESGLAEWKAEHLPGWLVPQPVMRTDVKKDGTSYHGGIPYAFTLLRSPALRQLMDLRPLLYAGRSRRVTWETLDALGPVGWAWWFADDGHGHRHAYPNGDGIGLSICRYSDEDRALIRAWVEHTFGSTSMDHVGHLTFSRDATAAFVDLVGPHVPPPARYKLPRWWQEVPYTPIPEDVGAYSEVVADVREYLPPMETAQQRAFAETSWCLTTETGNFFTTSGLVSNCYFDYEVLIRELTLPDEPGPTFDTILAFRAVHSELSRDLYTLGTLYTHVPDWKAAAGDRKIAVNPRTELELGYYACIDTTADIRAAEPLWKGVQARGQQSVVELDLKVQRIYREARHLGMKLDEDQRRELEGSHSTQRDVILGRIRTAVGSDTYNPRSTREFGRLLYQDFKLPVLFKTEGGEDSTDDDTIRALMVSPIVTPTQKQVLVDHRLLRKLDKELGTYIIPWRPWNDYRDEEEWEDHEGFLVTPDGRKKRKIRRTVRTGKRQRRGGLTARDGRIHPNYNVHCYDDQTEILTERGWIPFPALPRGLRVAQYEPGTHRVSFVHPTDYVHVPYEGPMVRLESEAMDLLVTPRHRCLVRSTKGAQREVLAEDFPTTTGHTTDWSSIHAGMWEGGPGITGLSEVEVRLLVMLQADGHIRANRSISFGFRRQRKIERCRVLLTQAGIPFREGWAGKDYRFYVGVRSWPRRILDLLGPDKTFGPWVLDLSRAQVDVLLDEVWYWDSAHDRKTQYASAAQENTDWIQALLVLSGTRTNLYHPRPTLSVLGVRRSDKNRITSRGVNEVVSYRGGIHCVSVPSTWVVIRRNGKVTVSGNTAATGRASSSEPNFQNIPSWLRCLLIAEEGNVLVDADFDQIELRLIALIAGLDSYKQAIWQGADPHAVTATLLYGDEFVAEMVKSFNEAEAEIYIRTKIPPKASHPTKRYKALRTLAKSFIYAVMYGGTAKTVFEIVASATDEKTGKLLFPSTTYEDIRLIYDRFMANLPALPRWWNEVWSFARANLYIDEPIGGRRRDFPVFERNQIPNHPIQGGAAIIMSRGLIRIREKIAPDFQARTGIVNQCHDAAIVECRERDAAEVKHVVETALYQKYGDMDFTAGAEIYYDWGHTKPFPKAA